MAIYTVLYAESESEVEKPQFRGPGAKIHEIRILENLSLFIFVQFDVFELNVHQNF